MTFFPSKRKENVRNWPGRAFSFRPSGTMKHKVFASEACGVMLANLRISGRPDNEVAARTGLTGAFAVPAGLSDLALAIGSLEGRRTTRVSMLKNTNAMKPIRAACRLGGDRKSTRLNSSHVEISYAVF